MNRVIQNTANTPEDSGGGRETSLDSAVDDVLPAHRITSSAWEGWWWGNPETQPD